METRYYQIKDLQTRDDSDELFLEGMFVVYNDIYEVWDGATERPNGNVSFPSCSSSISL